MVATWGSEPGPDETCEKCKSVYAVTITRQPSKDHEKFKCAVCGHLIREWNSTHSYDFELKHRGTAPSRA